MGGERPGRTAAFAALAALSMATGVAASLSGVASAAVPARPSFARAAVVDAAGGRHVLGLRLSGGATVPPASGLRMLMTAATAPPLPSSVDLRRYTVPVGNQGMVGSCAAWAIGYGMMGWFAQSQGHSGAPFAPMYAYSQVDGGADLGSSPASVFEVLRKQGIDIEAHYAVHHVSPYLDWRHLPSTAERTSAAANKIAGWITLYNTYPAPGASAKTTLERTLASGRPVALAIGVYNNFELAEGPDAFVSSTGAVGQPLGYHEVLAVGYTSRGVVIQNSWGTGWGDQGFATLDWNYVTQHSYEAETMAGLAVTANPSRPTVSTVSRTSGPWLGGQLVTVTGSRLGSSIVSIGGNSVAAQSVSSDGQRLTFAVPIGAVGTTNPLRISTPAGVNVGGAATYRYTS